MSNYFVRLSDRFSTRMSRLPPKEVVFYQSIFDKCDQNNDGSISVEELKTFLEADEMRVADHVLIKIRDFADKNQDGRIDFNEFVDLIKDPQFGYIFQKYVNMYINFIVSPKLSRRATVATLTGLYEDQYKCSLLSINLLLISILQFSVFYYDMALQNENNKIGPIANALQFEMDKRNQLWRYFTYALIHSDSIHLYGNLVIQLLVGVPLEMVHSWRVVVTYLAGAFWGSLFTSICNKSNLVGASAAVYSFYTAHIATVILNWREMSHPALQLIVFCLVTALDAVYQFYIHTGNEQTSYVAHLAGCIAGFLMGVIILLNINVTKAETILWWICFALFVLISLTLIVMESSNS